MFKTMENLNFKETVGLWLENMFFSFNLVLIPWYLTHRSGFPYNLIQARLQHETGIRPATQFYFPRRVWPHREILAPALLSNSSGCEPSLQPYSAILPVVNPRSNLTQHSLGCEPSLKPYPAILSAVNPRSNLIQPSSGCEPSLQPYSAFFWLWTLTPTLLSNFSGYEHLL